MTENGDRTPTPATAGEVAAALGLAPHPEGGYFREIYRSRLGLDTDHGPRALSTAVTFLVTAGSPSRFHRLASDELWVYQSGEPLELLLLAAGEPLQRVLLCDPLGAVAATADAAPVATVRVPAGVWQAARVTSGASDDSGDERLWTLVTCFVSPGFEYDDFELAERCGLLAAHPVHSGLIDELT